MPCSLEGKTVATSGKEEAAWNPDRFLGAETGWIWALLWPLKCFLSSCVCIWHLQKILTNYLHHCILLWSRMSNANCQWNFTIDFIIVIYFINNFNMIGSLMYCLQYDIKKQPLHLPLHREQWFYPQKDSSTLRLHYIKR